MVLINKAVLNTTAFPHAFLTLQLLVAVALLHLTDAMRLHHLPPFSLQTAAKLVPLSVINILGLTLNTLCLDAVDASFYQVSRGLVLPVTLALSAIHLQSRTSPRILAACALICTGFYIGHAGGSDEWRTAGMLYGILGSATTAVHAITIKKSLDAVRGDTVVLAYYSNVMSAAGCLFLTVVCTSEARGLVKLAIGAWVELGFGGSAVLVSVDQMMEDDGATFTISGATDMAAGSGAVMSVFVIGGMVSGAIGFLLSVAGILQIKVTSPVTHMISSSVRGVLQTILAVMVFGDVMTQSRVSSISLVLLGSFIYSWTRIREVARERRYVLPLDGKHEVYRNV